MMDWIFIKCSASEMVVGRFEIHVLKEEMTGLYDCR